MSTPTANQNYLKSYPYLFVRETDQTDYFCTLCDTYLKEEDLQHHLFNGHQAEKFQDCFVRVVVDPPPGQPTPLGFYLHKKYLYVCVVCWAKITGGVHEVLSHRRECKVDDEDDEDGDLVVADAADGGAADASNSGSGSGSGGEQPTNVVSTPDIFNMIDGGGRGSTAPGGVGSGGLEKNGLTNGSSNRSSPEIVKEVIDQPAKRSRKRTVPQHQPPIQPAAAPAPLPLVPPQTTTLSQQQHQQVPHFSSQCLQCTLCSMVVPSQGFLVHLRDFHRITCSLDDTNCPLCLSSVPLLELTLHLVSAHGIVPQSAVNAILLWCLSAMEKPKSGLTFKFGQPQPQPTPQQSQQLPPTQQLQATTQQPQQSHLQSLLDTSKLMSQQHALPKDLSTGSRASPATSAAPSDQVQIPTVLQSLLSNVTHGPSPLVNNAIAAAAAAAAAASIPSHPVESIPPEPRVAVENIVSKFTRCHVGPNGKESIQCLVCSKWFAVPPVKHLRGHMIAFKEDKKRLVSLMDGKHICIICYETFSEINVANVHLDTHHDIALTQPEPVVNHVSQLEGNRMSADMQADVPAVLDASLSKQPQTSPAPDNNQGGSHNNNVSNSGGKKKVVAHTTKGVELDNAGRVKSGKVRKQCELCGEWSNIKWFFKHMSEIHQALFCRCCREYLPIAEQEEHRRWHGEPPYMGQKIRIENGQPVIIDRKERASLTPIGSLASWGGSSGGMVVKAVDTGPPKAKKRRSNNNESTPGNTPKKIASSPSPFNSSGLPLALTPGSDANNLSTGSSSSMLIGHMDYNSLQLPLAGQSSSSPNSKGPGAIVKDTLMPKETCPVCQIRITYKNLARHIKLRHKIKYKFCHKCRRLVPNQSYDTHKNICDGTTDIEVEPLETGQSEQQQQQQQQQQLSMEQQQRQLQQHQQQQHQMQEDIDDSSSMKDEPFDTAAFLETSITTENEESNENEDDAAPNSGDGGDMGDDEGHDTSPPGEAGDDDEGDDDEARPKGDIFSTSTSKNKLESLLGREFKHPRRRCTICGYTVSYSNFKRHLRNAHPQAYRECEQNPERFKNALDELTTEVLSTEEGAGSASHLPGQSTDEGDDSDAKNDKDNSAHDSSFVECNICGDRILGEFLPRHMKMHANNGEDDGGDTSASESDKNKEDEAVSADCPVCNEALPAEQIVEHCRVKHKAAYVRCETCREHVVKKAYKAHVKGHEDDTNGDGLEKNAEFNCSECKEVFIAKADLDNHTKELHAAKETSKSKTDVRKGEAIDGLAEKLLPAALRNKKPISDEILAD